jgi:acyl-CoA synthetase (AMP-forming)/AMP-acid ligase II
MWSTKLEVQDIDAIAGSEPLAAWPEVHPDRWAYLPQTSGTTGDPRAWVISHRALASFLSWYVPMLSLEPGARMSHGLARSFDAALSEWLPALAGAGVVSPLPLLNQIPIQELDRELEQRKIAVLTMPAAYFELWSAIEEPPPECLRQVLVGGAPLRRSALAAWRQRCERHEHEVSVWNVYGPAEATIAISACNVTEPTHGPRPFAPVGSLSESLQVLDALGLPVLPGQPGEVWLHGPQLMEGRWTGDGGLEPRPSGPLATGDQAVVDESGAVTILGRTGDRVKVRGYWLHLRATEAAMTRELGLTQVSLTVDPSTGGRVRVVAVDPRQRPLQELRAAITDLLPPGVHPLVLTASRVPLDSRGTPDAAGLGDLGGSGAEPRPEPESLVWQHLSSVLDGQIPSPGEGFFANGGDSLRALQLQSLLDRKLGVQVDLERIFSAEDLCRLAEELDDQHQAAGNAKARS